MAELLAAGAVLGNGITAGIMLSTVMGIVPLTQALSYGRYVETIQFLWPRYDPFMPIIHVLTILFDLALVVAAPAQVGRVLFGAAGVLLVAVMAISVIKNVPINRFVMSLDPAVPPDDWSRTDPRRRWRDWNLLRTGLAVAALVVNAGGVLALM